MLNSSHLFNMKENNNYSYNSNNSFDSNFKVPQHPSNTIQKPKTVFQSSKQIKRPIDTITNTLGQPSSKRIKPENNCNQNQSLKSQSNSQLSKTDEYIRKYTKAFRNIVLYFDSADDNDKHEIVKMSTYLGAKVENFFSRKVTHVITKRHIPQIKHTSIKSPSTADKENQAVQPKNQLSRQATPTYGTPFASTSSYVLMSGNRTKSIVDTQPENPFLDNNSSLKDVLLKAAEFDMKIWTVDKVLNVLNYIFTHSTEHRRGYREAEVNREVNRLTHAKLKKEKRVDRELSLQSLLENEKVQGTTNERDNRMRRSNFYYFPRTVKYLLVEDASGKYGPVTAQEYSIPNSEQEPSWPILFANRDEYCPFRKYYVKEEPFSMENYTTKRWTWQKHVVFVLEAHLARLVRRGEVMVQSRSDGNKENNLQQVDETTNTENKEKEENQQAYAAASGNSVTITSATVTSQAPRQITHNVQNDKRLEQLNKRTLTATQTNNNNNINNDTNNDNNHNINANRNVNIKKDSDLPVSNFENASKISDYSAEVSFESNKSNYDKSSRRSSKGKPLPEEGSNKPFNAAQAFMKFRKQHDLNSTTSHSNSSNSPSSPHETSSAAAQRKLSRKSNEKFEENVAALKSRSIDSNNSKPRKETIETYNQVAEMMQKEHHKKHTERLKYRQENLKPGYCEICRMKFDDYSHHVKSSKHMKYARNPNIWKDLDALFEMTARPLASASLLVNSEQEQNSNNNSNSRLQIQKDQPIYFEESIIKNSQESNVPYEKSTTQEDPQTLSQEQQYQRYNQLHNNENKNVEQVREHNENESIIIHEPFVNELNDLNKYDYQNRLTHQSQQQLHLQEHEQNEVVEVQPYFDDIDRSLSQLEFQQYQYKQPQQISEIFEESDQLDYNDNEDEQIDLIQAIQNQPNEYFDPISNFDLIEQQHQHQQIVPQIAEKNVEDEEIDQLDALNYYNYTQFYDQQQQIEFDHDTYNNVNQHFEEQVLHEQDVNHPRFFSENYSPYVDIVNHSYSTGNLKSMDALDFESNNHSHSSQLQFLYKVPSI